MIDFQSTNSGVWARPCEIPGIKDFIHSCLATVDCYSSSTHQKFLETYYSYLSSGVGNQIIGIDKFEDKSYIHGTTQAFDEFYLKHHHKRLRTFPGEFAYHKIAARSGNLNWVEITSETPLKTGDCLVLSVPFSASCDIYPNITEILNTCDSLNIPVHLDFAYLGISRDITIDVNHKSIYSLSFSLSKVYYGTERLRIGMRLKRRFEDDYINFANEYKMYNIAGAWTGLQLLTKKPPHVIFDKLQVVYNEIISEFKYSPNKTCLFGTIPKDHQNYITYKRGESNYSRICLSEFISHRLIATGEKL